MQSRDCLEKGKVDMLQPETLPWPVESHNWLKITPACAVNWTMSAESLRRHRASFAVPQVSPRDPLIQKQKKQGVGVGEGWRRSC